MRYVNARLQTEQREETYRIYISDILRSSVAWEQAPPRYAEIAGHVKTDTRSGDEIAEDVISGAGLVVNDESI